MFGYIQDAMQFSRRLYLAAKLRALLLLEMFWSSDAYEYLFGSTAPPRSRKKLMRPRPKMIKLSTVMEETGVNVERSVEESEKIK